MIDLAALFKAPAIIGSMQGRIEPGTERDIALTRLADGLRELSAHAKSKKQFLLYEPLNRYETNVFHRLEDTTLWLRANKLSNVKILADLFHMNIEESDLPNAIRAAGAAIGHVHFADSNRRAVGMGHTRMKPIIAALEEMNYRGYLSAEIFPFPDSEQAATQTIKSFKRLTSH
jgi:sugar phosphate isomerase/epimerase